jgi:hypothetical protein
MRLELIVLARHDELVFGYFLIAFLVLVGLLAYVAGVDSRIDESSRRHRYRG